jgi:glycosyltransferase involved in cell wall biosynthesis
MHRVLHIVCFPELYGTQRSMLSTVKCLDRGEFEPFVAAPADEEFEREVRAAGAEFIPVPMLGLRDGRSARLLREAIKSRGIGIIHCHLGISSYLGLRAARPLGVPAVVTRHFIADRYTTTLNPLKRIAYKKVYQWMNSRFAKIICVSGAVRDAVVERENAPPGKCVVIHNGVCLEEMAAGAAAAGARPEQLRDLPPGRKVILTVSRLAKEKGLYTLLDAAMIVSRAKLDIEVVIAGEGKLRKRLKEHAFDIGLGGRLKMPGFVDNIRELLAAADVFVLPALNEPFGIAVIEAMAAGRPIIASASGGPLEIITDGKSGLLAPPRDAEQMAVAMFKVLRNPDTAAELSRGALEEVRRFDEKLIARQVEEVYREALK